MEKAMAWSLVGLGLALIIGVFIWFGASSDDFTLKSKEVVTTEPVGDSGEKSTTETDYADTVVIFAMTIGAGLVLAGAFYGRLREITIGGAILKLGPTEEQKETVAQKAEEKVKQQASPEQAEILAPVAKVVAEEQLEAHSLLTVAEPSDNQLDAIAEVAANRVLEAAQVQ
jgi:hypothetical protein